MIEEDEILKQIIKYDHSLCIYSVSIIYIIAIFDILSIHILTFLF